MTQENIQHLIYESLKNKVSAENWTHLSTAWVNEMDPKEVAKNLGIPIEAVRGAYFAKDLGFAEDNEGFFFSENHGSVNG